MEEKYFRILKNAEEIRAYCKSKHDCSSCIFSGYGDYISCIIDYPIEWLSINELIKRYNK